MIRERSHRDRREALMAQHGDGPILVRGAGPSGVNPNFVYLTGLGESRGALLLSAEGIRIGTGAAYPGPDYVCGAMANQLLFLPAPNPLAARWGEDSAGTFDGVPATDVQVDAVFPVSDFEVLLVRALESSPVLHYVRGGAPSLSDPGDADAAFVEKVRRGLFGVAVRDVTGSVSELRRLKDEGEIRAIERAGAVTTRALDTVLGSLRAGMREHEIEAEITRVYRSSGATHAFDPIVACGLNAVYPHYHANSGPVEAGKLLLVDTGAALDGYRSDVTRTYPVDGRFGKRQREIYEIVLRSQREAIALCRAGALLADIHAHAFRVIDDAGFGDAFIHGTGHHLGLETHDAGDVHRPLAEGAVITIEPGIYLPDEEIGVRIEDDILVTDGEPRVLTEAIPSSVDAIERRMA